MEGFFARPDSAVARGRPWQPQCVSKWPRPKATLVDGQEGGDGLYGVTLADTPSLLAQYFHQMRIDGSKHGVRTMTQAHLGYPLDGLKVLDFSRVLAGPFASRMLCDLGADVVKVEPPEGDSTRLWGKMTAGISGYFNMANAGKRSISIDLRAMGAAELVLALAGKADVVIENFRPDVMTRLGIGYERLSAINPRLIMLSISGFGRHGPESQRPAYAPIVHAELGLIDRVQRRDGARVDLPLSVADTNAGLHGIIALLSALLMRDRTGLGQHIDIAMMDATLVSDDQLHFEIEDAEATRNLPPDIWDTGVGAILVSVDFRHMWRLLTTSFGLAGPTKTGMDLNAKILARRSAVADFMRGLTTWEQVEDVMAKMILPGAASALARRCVTSRRWRSAGPSPILMIAQAVHGQSHNHPTVFRRRAAMFAGRRLTVESITKRCCRAG